MYQTDFEKVIFSFILPIYNVEDFLPDCLDSLLHQDFTFPYEIICVNDGSTDKSGQIVRTYQRHHSNIRLIEKENGGVSSARNAGLRQAAGEYVWFVDPDDYIVPNCLEGIYAALFEYHGAEILYFNVREVAEDALPDITDSKTAVHIIPGAKALVETCGMVNKICKRTFLLKNRLWVNENIAYGEDILWSNLAALACENYIVSDAVLYYYRQRKTSFSGMKNLGKNAERRLADSVAITENYFKLYRTQKNPAKRKKLSRLYRIHTERALLLFAIDRWEKMHPSQFLSVLKTKGLYPFCPVGFQLIPCNDLKTTLCNWLTFGFFFRPYYYLVCQCMKLKFIP